MGGRPHLYLPGDGTGPQRSGAAAAADAGWVYFGGASVSWHHRMCGQQNERAAAGLCHHEGGEKMLL